MTSRSSDRHRGRRDQEARALLALEVEAGVAVCWRCLEPIRPGQRWDAGHLEDLVAGASPSSARRPEHALRRDCKAGGNRSAGAKAGAAHRAGRRTRISAWLEASDL